MLYVMFNFCNIILKARDSMTQSLLGRINSEAKVVSMMNSVLVKELDLLSQKVKEMNIRLLEMNADIERARIIRDSLEAYERES
jgi:hypothetical protein